jgi:purine-binding chemotaxis protein CheW
MFNVSKKLDGQPMEFATFYIGKSLIGIDIHQIREINRQIECTTVLHAPYFVKGVLNLRGEVVTVIDLRKVLKFKPSEDTRLNRTIVIKTETESVGFLVDRVADVVSVQASEIISTPSNLTGLESHFFSGLIKLDKQLLLLLDIEKALLLEEVEN